MAQGADDDAPFKIETTEGADYLVKLSRLFSSDYATIFVKGGTTVTTGVPLGDYELRFVFGTNWYGYEHGNYFFYQIHRHRLPFSHSRSLVPGTSSMERPSLSGVPGGNLETHAVPLDEF